MKEFIFNALTVLSILIMYNQIVVSQLNQDEWTSKKEESSNFNFHDTIYSFSKQYVSTVKTRIQTGRITEDSLSRLFTSLLTEKLIPHWLTTPWSFEGHTSIPRQGKIACGYFVSTTLLHMGFNVNRYKFAQQLPVNEAKT